MRSIRTKLVLGFGAVALVGVLVVAFLINQFTTGEFGNYVEQGIAARDQRVAAYLSDSYRSGGWAGVSSSLPALSHWTGMRLIVVDPGGRVVVDSEGQQQTGAVPDSLPGKAVPIVVEGGLVGNLYLLVPTSGSLGMMGSSAMMDHMRSLDGRFPMMGMAMAPLALDSREGGFLEAVGRATWVAGGLALLVALLLGMGLSYRITSPVKRLTSAAGRVAAGDFAQRVEIDTRDEIASLGEAFNSMAESLARTERQRRQLLGDIAHELNTPITVLQGNLEAMIDGLVEPTSDKLSSLRDETLLLSRLVTDLRDLSLAETGHLHLNKKAVDLGELVASAASAVQAEARARGVDLSVTIQPELPLVSADPDRVGQVLRNLLGNALRYTPAGGTITVSANSHQATGNGQQASAISHQNSGLRAQDSRLGTRHFVEVSVADTGVGIPPEDLPKLFDRFFRVDRSRNRGSGGTGLGLAVVKQLVEAHGGRVWAESETGKGSVFHFTLPVMDAGLWKSDIMSS